MVGLNFLYLFVTRMEIVPSVLASYYYYYYYITPSLRTFCYNTNFVAKIKSLNSGWEFFGTLIAQRICVGKKNPM